MKSYRARLRLLVARRLLPPSGLLLLAAAAILPARAASDYSTPYSFTTLAGLSSIGNDDGPASAARFSSPHGVTVDAAGNLFVADKGNHTIRKITPDGVVSTIAGKAGYSGSADGIGEVARFNQPFAIAVDTARNLYVADTVNLTVRKITPTGAVTTLAGLAGTQGSSDGSGSAARFCIPSGIAVDAGGNVYVADSGNNTIRKITPAGAVTTLAGTAGVFGSADGTGAAAEFFYPLALAVDAQDTIYLAEAGSCAVRKITPAGEVTTLVAAGMSIIPQGIAVDRAGNVFVSDYYNIIRKIAAEGSSVLAGKAGAEGSADGIGGAARFRNPFGLTTDAAGNLFVADRDNNTIRKITPSAAVTTIAGLGLDSSLGSTDGPLPQARFNSLASAAFGPAGEIYVADTINSTIRKIVPDGVVSTLAGSAGTAGSADGTGSAALFNSPYGIAVDATGTVYVSDPGNDNIRKITPTGIVTTVAGDATAPPGYADGTGSAARFNYPSGLAADGAGNVYVADRDNSAVRKITPAGVVTSLAGTAGSPGSTDGTGSAAAFETPQGVAVDSAGNIYVANAIRHGAIKKISPAGAVTILAGGAGGEADSADGVGTAARFNKPLGLTVDRAGIVYVSDSENHTIRRILPTGVVSTLAGLAAAPAMPTVWGVSLAF
ncbi:MAG TPA: NHL repeat-containing protein [Opitutaceae bacterium]|nr:NHL repeat-containing protein [Opitutaceae bacterium]